MACAIWIAIVLRGRIPRWMFDFQVALTRWQVRAFSYPALLTDAYPPFEGDYPIRFDVEYPEKVSRWKVLIWKYITSMPHGFVLSFLWIGAFFSVIIGWFAILITGRFPKGLHGYVAGVIRWQYAGAGLLLLPHRRVPALQPLGGGRAGRARHLHSILRDRLSVDGGLHRHLHRGALLRGPADSASRGLLRRR